MKRRRQERDFKIRLAGGTPEPETITLGEIIDDGQPTPAWERTRQMAMQRDAARRRN